MSVKRAAGLATLYDITGPGDELEPSYNAAPTDTITAVIERHTRDETDGPKRRLKAVRWGLVPSWAKDPSIGSG